MGNGKRRRPKVKRFIESRRALYLETLRRTGTHGAAARAAGVDRSTAEQRRKRDAAFALACIAAEAEAGLRLAGASDPFDGVEDAHFETTGAAGAGACRSSRPAPANGTRRWRTIISTCCARPAISRRRRGRSASPPA